MTALVIADVARSMVYPSGAALTTDVAPTVPPPPGRFSSTKCCPSCDPAGSSTACATVSQVVPAANGLTTIIERFGHSSARTERAAINMTATEMAAHSLRMDGINDPRVFFQNTSFNNVPTASTAVMSATDRHQPTKKYFLHSFGM